MPDNPAFESPNASDMNHARLDAEWATLIAIRELLGIALKGVGTPTYQQALEFGKSLSHTLFDSDETVLGGRERQIVKEYRQRAEAESAIHSRPVAPLEVLDEEIKEFKAMVRTPGDRDLIEKRLRTLDNLRPLLQPKAYTENQLILRDVFKVHRSLLDPPIEGDTYRDFRLDNDRGLRIRLAHPDKPEHSTGADLIYENYWHKRRVIRISFVQYKLWDGATLYSSASRNLAAQLARLKNVLCDTGFCEKAQSGDPRYRLPHCCAFLRPSDKLQDSNSRLISSGLHVPICVIANAWEATMRGGKRIERKNIRSEALSPKVFEELFNTNMLGSRWLSYDAVQTLYRKHKILAPQERIILHAQEFSL